MARGNFPLQVFNRGRISRLGLARTDLDRTKLSAETQTNWIPRSLGSMMVRPGLGYIGGILSDNACRIMPFIFSSTDTALVEITDSNARVWVSDAVVTRVGSTAVITGGTFTSTSLAGWTDADESGSTSEWVTGNYMSLTGTKYARAIRRQTVTASSGTHGLAISVNRGYPTLKVGSSSAGDDYFSETVLKKGVYSLAITSTGDFYIELSAKTEYGTRIESVAIESSGDMTLSTPWVEADLSKLRWKQSGDVFFVAADGYQQRRIERHAAESWACVVYEPDDGPFRTINVTNKRLTPSGLKGEITLSADQPVFNSSHVGALFEITTVGQEVSATVTGADQWSNAIRVAGVSADRTFNILISQISTDIEMRVQRSVGDDASWTSPGALDWTSTIDTTHSDGLDNQIVYYRIGVGTTDYTSTSSGTATGTLTYASGGITGRARITAVAAATESSAIVLTDFGSTTTTELWSEGAWSNYRGWPTSVTIHEGRVVWAGRGSLWASITDAYESFDADFAGDAGPISRTLGEGPIDTIEWLMSQNRLIIGTQGQEAQAKTSSLEEPLTPSNFSIRDISTQGSADVQAVKVDQTTFFVQSGGTRVMEITGTEGSLGYATEDRTVVVPEIGEPAIDRMAVQRQPDTRLHCVRSDGTVAMLVNDPAEGVLAWLDIETDGTVEEAAVLPGTIEDSVYYVVKREINGSTKRYLEKWALESEARGGSTNKMADSFVVQNSTSTTLVSGLDHLVGETVTCWGSSADLGTYTVSTTGTFTASAASTEFITGLPYYATYISAKLAYAAENGTALTQKKKINHVGIVAADMHAQGLQFGTSTGNLNPLPRTERGVSISTDSVWSAYDATPIIFPGKWDTDSRLVLFGQAPRPATVLGAIIAIETKEKG